MRDNSQFPKDNFQDDLVDLSVVIPVFNEEANIPIVIEDTLRTLNQQYEANPYELILVNDGSTDSTGRICDTLAQQYPSVQVFHHAGNQGIGAALKTGLTNAVGAFVSAIPGDGQVSIDQVLKLRREIGDADLIVGARENYDFVHESPFKTVYRKFLTSVWRYLIILIVHFDPADKYGDFVIRNDVLKTLRLRSTTGLLIIEMVMKCYRRGCAIKESTITVKPRVSGQSKVTNVTHYIKLLWEILQLRFKR